jgi:hypothetical protein
MNVTRDAQDDAALRYGYYVVAYIDLLGQQEELASLRALPTTSENEQKIQATLKRTAGEVLRLRQVFTRYFKALFDSQDRISIAATISDEQHRQEYLALRAPPVIHQMGFSDSVVIAVPFDEEFGEARNARAVVSTLYGVAGVALESLARKVPIRGGVEVNTAINLSPNEIYGVALMDAYRLEAQVAEYPRVVVGRELLRFLSHVEQLPASDRWSSLANGFVRQCFELICPAPDDGWPMVDFLSETILDTHPEVRALSVRAREWIRAQAIAFETAGNEKLSRRYRRLLLYFDSVANEGQNGVIE